MNAPLPAAALPDHLLPLDGGVFAVDTGFHRDRFDAAYLIVDDGRAAFVDTGTAFAVPRLLGALDALGIARDAVDWVIPTHVHLDHAGGAGALMRELPAARMLVHPRGLRHMIDPTALWQGALAVYGEAEMQRSYREVVPVDADRVAATADGSTVTLGGRELAFADIPGHARHHHGVWDPVTRGWFSGDTFGLSYREFDTAAGPWVVPSATPVQFDPVALRGSIAKMLAREPRWMYLTHFGRVGDVARLGRQLLALVDEIEAMALACGDVADAAERHARLADGQRAIFRRSLAAHGCTLDGAEIERLLAIDVELNAQGLAIWLDARDGSRGDRAGR